jgi:hypothetical protein
MALSKLNANHDIDPQKWYSAPEAAAYLGVKEQTVTGYCREGRLLRQAEKIGPKMRWHIRGSEIIRLRKEWRL